jgi:hypothetical protein
MAMNVTIHVLVSVEVAYQINIVNGVNTRLVMDYIVRIDAHLAVTVEHVIKVLVIVLVVANLVILETNVIHAYLEIMVSIVIYLARIIVINVFRHQIVPYAKPASMGKHALKHVHQVAMATVHLLMVYALNVDRDFLEICVTRVKMEHMELIVPNSVMRLT